MPGAVGGVLNVEPRREINMFFDAGACEAGIHFICSGLGQEGGRERRPMRRGSGLKRMVVESLPESGMHTCKIWIASG